MLIGTVPFKAGSMSELHQLINKANFKFSERVQISNEAKDLIENLLVVDPKQRLTVPQILNHPWLKDPED